jgi:predicted RNase H-like nuclease
VRVTGIDASRRGWVAVALEVCGPSRLPRLAEVRVHPSLATLLGQAPDAGSVVGIDMPLGLLEAGWREADRAARGLLGPRRSSVFAIPPRSVWLQDSYPAANRRCRELTGQGLSVQTWGLRARLLEADQYRELSPRPLYEVHPELAFGALAGAPLPYSKHTPAGRELRRELLARTGIEPVTGQAAVTGQVPAAGQAPVTGQVAAGQAPVTDLLDAAAVAWSAWRIATGQAVVLPGQPQRDDRGREIAIRF